MATTTILPLLVKVGHISPCYAYRHQQHGETEIEYGLRVANELEQEILTLGADNVMAFVAEPVVGATMGVVSAVAGYFSRIREICDQYGVLLILDEVICGMGRTGKLFACEHDQVEPDLFCIAKGLGVAGKVKKAAFEARLICYPMAGTIDGDHVLLAPPFVISEAQIDELVAKLGQSISQVLDH